MFTRKNAKISVKIILKNLTQRKKNKHSPSGYSLFQRRKLYGNVLQGLKAMKDYERLCNENN